MGNKQTNTKETFFSRIIKQPNGCHEFQSYQDRDGYRFFTYMGREYKAHRLAVVFDGRDPTGKVVCHTCDNPACVNPEHLFIGSSKDNHNDMVNKGRSAGNKINHSRYATHGGLPQELRNQIKNDTGTNRELSVKYNLHEQTIRKYRSH